MCQASFIKPRLITIKKKDKQPDKVENLQAIQILPTDVRLLEQLTTFLRKQLIDRLEQQKELYAFLPGKSNKRCITDWVPWINKSDRNIYQFKLNN